MIPKCQIEYIFMSFKSSVHALSTYIHYNHNARALSCTKAFFLFYSTASQTPWEGTDHMAGCRRTHTHTHQKNLTTVQVCKHLKTKINTKSNKINLRAFQQQSPMLHWATLLQPCPRKHKYLAPCKLYNTVQQIVPEKPCSDSNLLRVMNYSGIGFFSIHTKFYALTKICSNKEQCEVEETFSISLLAILSMSISNQYIFELCC